MKKLLALAFFVSAQALAQTEVILDNGSAAFATTGTWPASASVSGYFGTDYQSHVANGAPPDAVVVDNTDPGFSVTGTWTSSTSVSGYLGANYQHHFANGEPPTAVVADNLAGSFTDTWPASTSVGGYYATNYQHHAAGTGASSFTWTLNVATAGTYEVYARWTQHPNRATNAKYTVNHSGGSNVVTVNQALGGGSWQLLGSFSFDAGATTVSLSDEADGYVIADAVMIVPPGAEPNAATWSATIPTAGSYEVYARWTQHPNRASNAKYTVSHAGGSTQVIVNQMAGGGTWSQLGTFSFDAGPASVAVTDQADGYVIADAVMFLPQGAGPNSATWTPNVAQSGQYEVYARWTAHANRASDATYTVTHAGGETPVPVNQQANGGVWNLLGTFSLSPGTAHKVTLTDVANGYVIADAIRLVPVTVQAEPALYFVHTDHLNTPRLVADSAQQTVWRWDQAEPFGNNPADEDPDGNSVAFDLPLRLPGQRYDAETGLHYNYFRDYDPSVGRYGESDPIGLDGGLNTYAYVDASPLGDADPLGLVKWTGTLTVVDLGIGPKIGRHGPRIPILRHNQIQLVLESECVAGKKQHAIIRAEDPESREWRHSPQTWLRGSVELEDGLSVPDARQLQGAFSLDMFGLLYARGHVSTGRGVGTFSGLGLVGGGYSFRGRSHLLRPPKEESCVCKPQE